jgi:hypothetical protein
MRDLQRELIQSWARSFVQKQSKGEWHDDTINRDAELMTNEIVSRLAVWSASAGIAEAAREHIEDANRAATMFRVR